MKALFIILANVFLAFSALAEATTEAASISNTMVAGRSTTLLEFLAVVFVLGVVFKLFGVENKKTVVAEKPKITLNQIVTKAVGELKPIGGNTTVGSVLLENKDDIATYLFVAKVDKGTVRAEEKVKALKVQKSTNKAFLIMTTIIVTSIVLNVVLFLT